MKPNLPPQDLEAERSVIGGMMLSDGATDDALLVVGPEHFYSEANAKLFAAVRDMRTAGKPCDSITIGHEMARRKELEAIGGAAYIVQCLESVPHGVHTAYHAGIVRDKADRRTCIEHASRIAQAAYDESQDNETAVATIEESITRLVESRARDTRTNDLTAILMEAVTRIEQGKTLGIKTGIDPLDEITTGMHAGQLIVVGARPSQGKTALAINIAMNIARSVPTLFFSMEMPCVEIAERMLAIESAISVYDMRTGRLSEQEQWELTESANRLNSLPILIDDEAHRSLMSIASTTRAMKRRKNVGLVIIDYLQLMNARDSKVHREQQIAEMSRGLKLLAKSLSIPVIVLAQLNRESVKRADPTPRLSDLRESGAIEQDADQVWLLHRPALCMDPTESGYDACRQDAQLIVAKNRSGPSGKADLIFQETIMRFSPAAVQAAQFVESGRW